MFTEAWRCRSSAGWVRIDYGDGTVAVDGVVRQPSPATNLSSNGVFTVPSGQRWFPVAGSFHATITITTSGGTQVTRFTVTVKH